MFAPTIRHHRGKFHVICTQVGPRGDNFVVTAERPEGPWSDPVWFRGIPGIDPSLFFDEGRSYVVFNAEPPDNKSLYHGHAWGRATRSLFHDPSNYTGPPP